jgi:hypothetical protein
MAALDCIVNSGTQALTSNAERTLLQLKAATFQRIKVKGYSVTMGGIVVKNLIVRVVMNTDAGVASTTLTPTKLTRGAAETIQTVAKTGFSSEPTAGDVLQFKRLQSSYEKIFPMGQEIIVEGGGWLGIAVTSVADSAELAAEFLFEE